LRKRNSLLVAAAVVLAASLISFSFVLGESPKKHTYPPTPSTWTGYNSRLSHYYVAPGYPSYEAHPRYLGELTGSWEEIGKQYGEKAGDLIRMVYEGWYRELLAVQGSPQAFFYARSCM